MLSSRLAALDYVVFAAYCLVLVGIWWGARRRTRAAAPGEPLRVPAWVAAIAMVSANVGAVEVIGMGASGAKYGLASLHLYWLGTIPALLVLARVVLPVYAASGAQSLPDYLRRRFDARTGGLAAAALALTTIVVAGVSLYVMGKLLQLVFGLGFVASALLSAAVALLVVLLVRLVHLLHHEVMQFVLLVLLVVPLGFLGLRATGGWERLLPVRLVQAAINSQLPQTFYTHTWKGMGDPRTNALGVEWVGLLLGVGFVLSFGYWCTDYLVTQRARTPAAGTAQGWAPLLAGLPKLLLPLLMVVPGLAALILGGGEGGAPYGGMGQGVLIAKRAAGGAPLLDSMGRTVLDFDLATPLLLAALAPPGMLGLGLVALIAAALSGMVGNLFAFRAIWRQEFTGRGAGAEPTGGTATGATLGAFALAIGVAWAANAFNNVMELLQLVFAFVHAPLLAVVGLGMLWRRTTAAGAAAGLAAGLVAAAGHHALAIAYGARAGIAGGYLAPLLVYRSELALAAWTAIVAFTTALVVGGAVSLGSPPRPTDELYGLVRSLLPPPAPGGSPRVRGATAFAVLLVGGAIALNLGFAR